MVLWGWGARFLYFSLAFFMSSAQAGRAWLRELIPDRHERFFQGLQECERSILSFNRGRRAKILRPNERDFIRRITDAPTRAERRGRLKIAYRYFFERQIRGLKPELQNWLRALKVSRSAKSTLFAQFFLNDDEERIDIQVPQKLLFSVLDYSFLVHEFEHAIQMLSIVDDYREGRVPYLRGLQSSHYVFLQEDGAMAAEWEWLHSLSPAARADCEEDLAARGLTEFQNWLVDAAKPLREYLRLQRQRGRYSLDHVLALQREDRGRIRFSELMKGVASP